MNERIRELVEQADINIDSFQFSGTPIKYIVGESSLEKFAELIVRECFKAAMIESKGHMNPVDLMDAMKKRVGVE